MGTRQGKAALAFMMGNQTIHHRRQAIGKEKMYQEHPVFKQPPDENIRIWRYMDFTKFVSVLDTQSLFFSRSDRLGDLFEGAHPTVNVILLLQQFSKGNL